jgi:hypothetical protein
MTARGARKTYSVFRVMVAANGIRGAEQILRGSMELAAGSPALDQFSHRLSLELGYAHRLERENPTPAELSAALERWAAEPIAQAREELATVGPFGDRREEARLYRKFHVPTVYRKGAWISNPDYKGPAERPRDLN